MATDNKSSILIDDIIPEFLDTEGPKFKAFMRAYYEWLETTNQITDRSKNLLKYGDIDTTDNEFIKYFQREVLADFPEDVLANKALLVTRIKDLYRSKGSEQAYKMLFRLLYDDEVDFYYPGEDILRVSDGRWVKEQALRLSAPFTGSLYDIGGKNVTGATSGATAKVNRVTATLEQGIEVFEIFLTNVVGTFQDREIVRTTDNVISGRIISSVGPLQGVDIQFGGSKHRVGDRVRIISSSGSGANGAVTTVEGSSIVPVLVDGGSGYTTDATVTLIGGSGSGAIFQVDSINNTETITTYDDTISDLSGTRIDANTFITSNTGTLSANLAIANSSTVLSAALGTSNTTVGTIASMSATERGSGYSILPSVSVRQDNIADQEIPDGSGGIKGFNAVVTANSVGGSITGVNVDNAGSRYNRTELLTIQNLTRSATNATGSPLITGVIDYDGKYTDTKGFISWNNKLQDNYYYQQFAYVLRSKQSMNTYREIVKKLLHPAGTNVFADLMIESNAALEFSANTYIFYSIEFAALNSITSTASVGTPTVTPTLSPTAIAPTAAFGTHQLDMFIDTSSITTTANVSNPEILLSVGGAELISITSTLSIPVDHQVLAVGPGTISNFIANNISDLSADQIDDYDALTISTLPGNKIYDGIGTSFDTQLSPGSQIIFTSEGEEFTLNVSSIDDANTLAVTANATYANGDLAVISGLTYFYTS
jgi:hypothetical protein